MAGSFEWIMRCFHLPFFFISFGRKIKKRVSFFDEFSSSWRRRIYIKKIVDCSFAIAFLIPFGIDNDGQVPSASRIFWWTLFQKKSQHYVVVMYLSWLPLENKKKDEKIKVVLPSCKGGKKERKKVLIAVNHRVVASSPTKSHILIKSTIGRTNNSIPRVENSIQDSFFFSSSSLC